ncbi:MAG: DUF3467 domain-containing protein [Thermoguttaceae bacterium]|nr:DUF3467 domain-containing protein [Thermoguttaceae bacterium]
MPEEQQVRRQSQFQLDDTHTVATYANLCRVTGTPEEVFLDFGINSQPAGAPTGLIPMGQRIVLNFYTAKRLYHALGMTIQRHEKAFGILEIDVNKRIVQQESQGN